MSDKFISVALCTYNGDAFLTYQIESILVQSSPVNEIVICDDGSKDSTKEILEKFQKNYPSIIKLHFNQYSLGVVRNFEKAISLCTGDIIFLSDQDDLWKINKVKIVMKKFQDNDNIEAIFTDGNIIDDNNKIINDSLWNTFHFTRQEQNSWLNWNHAISDLIYHRNKITGATLSFRKRLFERAIPFPIFKGLWHDGWLGVNAAANKSLAWIDQPLIEYRVHSYQQVGIGNGTTVNNNLTSNSVDFLLETKTTFENCLLIIENLQKRYSDIETELLRTEALDWIYFIDLRLGLPSNLFFRANKIVKNISSYTKHSRSALKTILNDLVNPKKKSFKYQ